MPTAPTTAERLEVEKLVCDLPGRRPADSAFTHPWEIRAFALAVTAHKEGRIRWDDFQAALADSIKRWEDSVDDLGDSSWSYYHHWVDALERVLKDNLNQEALEDKTRKVLDTPANRNHHKAILEPIAIDPGRP